jgi:hypothetical protein
MRSRSVLLVVVAVLVGTACAREGGLAIDATPVPIITPAPLGNDLPSAAPSPTATATASPTPIPTATATAAGTPAATARCRNSTEASCGAFRFDPAPQRDDAIAVKVTFSPKEPKAGDTVTFSLTATDPDSEVVLVGTYRFGKGQSAVVVDDAPDRCPRAYGAWDPPQAKAGSADEELRHTYRDAGRYEAEFSFYSRSYTAGQHTWPTAPPGDSNGRCIDPLASSGTNTVTITVT